jgi:hypothetical protein
MRRQSHQSHDVGSQIEFEDPFNNYLPFPLNNELDPQKMNEETIATRYCQSVLQKRLHLSQIKMEMIKWVFLFGDPIELCYTVTEFFTPSTALDYQMELVWLIFLTVLVVDLVRNWSPLCYWARLAPTVIHYLKEALCAPLVYYPTLYGLGLALFWTPGQI